MLRGQIIMLSKKSTPKQHKKSSVFFTLKSDAAQNEASKHTRCVVFIHM